MATFYLIVSLVMCVFANWSAVRYSKKHNVPREHILPFWPAFFYACGAIGFCKCLDIWLH